MITVIKHEGINGDSVAPDLAVPMIATHDIADVAAKALKARDWEGVVVRELLGPYLLRGHAHPRRAHRQPDLKYVQISYAEMAQALVQAGLSESFAGLYVEMTRSFNEGKVKPSEGRKPENTTPRRFEDFASELAGAYRAA